VERLASEVIGALDGLPAVLVYLVAAVWVGIEAVGIGLPVEPVMLFFGSLVATGRVNLALAILVTGAGCAALGSLSYVLGRRYGKQTIARFGRYVGLPQARADHLELWLRHRGTLGVGLLRLTPLVRSFAALISGVAEVPRPVFALGMFVGSAVYCGVFIVLGALLGANYQAPLRYLDRFGIRGVAAVVGVVVVLIAAHQLSGRLAFRRLARHFHLHHQMHHAQAVAHEVDL
jgi:membrane protein DedA with SNARE-associated domain